MDFDWALRIMEHLAGQPLLFIALAIGLSFISEDAVTVGTALLAAQGLIGWPLGFLAVNIAIILGDGALYGAGALAARYRFMRRLVATRRIYQTKRWVEQRLGPILLATRFMPGTRFPTYTASGFFGFSFPFFIAILSLGSVLWTGLVFIVIFYAGKPFLDALGPWKWLGAIIILLFGLVVPHFIGPICARIFGVRPLPEDHHRS
ncbi:hypothetical protein JCM17846_14650 [Iodidimonas nitroreducens]|uniref:VTT domain-containing protein n=1 Tax=Iodidimonas nitroreducens TaxID=1236968 RepID=A0A5A7N636_9PROT|nr:VTT domain-containing protein [Iodidimonas nitroreducens]GAK34115.1 SNARE associated Golgi protein [alpha proteobacterium Q-1]GER03783.1 hypothetical protein JCM17846_14650 [Iodidimonas nitroreducens]